jgi:serine/threonine protein kinase
VEPIAKGGMAEIYRARQVNLEREVALKEISDEFFESFDGDSKEIQVTIERFCREVRR